MANLYQLTEDFWELVESVDVPLDKENPDAEVESWMRTLQELLDTKLKQLDEKFDAIACVVRQLEAEETMIANERRRFYEREKAVKKHKERLKAFAVNTAMNLIKADPKGRRRIDTERFKVWIQRKPLSIDDEKCDPLKLDDAFVSFEPKIKKRELLEHIKTTGELPDGAELKPEGWTLRIK